MGKRLTRRRQKALERKAARRKAKKARLARSTAPRSQRGWLRQSVNWPVLECLLTKDWRNTEQISQALVARLSPSGQVAVGAFLIDLGCLGVKNAFGRVFRSQWEYARDLRDSFVNSQEMIEADINLVAKIVREAVSYAKSLGLEPHRDYYDAALVLADADPDACDEEVPLGRDGKPFYVAGPYDNVERIMNTLLRNLGPDGFLYIVPVELEDLDELDIEYEEDLDHDEPGG